MSTTHSRLGASAWKLRLTRSGGQPARSAGMVVRVARPRRTPRRAAARISRSPVHRAQVMPSRCSCSHTLRACHSLTLCMRGKNRP